MVYICSPEESRHQIILILTWSFSELAETVGGNTAIACEGASSPPSDQQGQYVAYTIQYKTLKFDYISFQCVLCVANSRRVRAFNAGNSARTPGASRHQIYQAIIHNSLYCICFHGYYLALVVVSGPGVPTSFCCCCCCCCYGVE